MTSRVQPHDLSPVEPNRILYKGHESIERGSVRTMACEKSPNVLLRKYRILHPTKIMSEGSWLFLTELSHLQCLKPRGYFLEPQLVPW